MPQFHLSFPIPDSTPFDRPDWQIQAQGELIRPFVMGHQPLRFWFSHYGGLGVGKHVLIRYESDSKADTSALAIQPSEHEVFDIHSDLGGERFRDPTNPNATSESRGSTIFDFLHATAKLTLDQLMKSENGYWSREESPDRGNNHFGSPLESFHHLFCNITGVKTAVVLVPHGKSIQIMSPLYAKNLGQYGPGLQEISVRY